MKKMHRVFVNLIVAVLLVVDVHFTMAYPSDIHKKMTKAERLAVFGSEDSVPEYQVFPMSLPGDRHKRETNKAIQLTIVIENKTVNLNLKPAEGYLATKHTPVWLANSSEHAYQNIRYDPRASAMSNIGEFKMYHDVKNEAAVTTYTDCAEGTIIEGMVTRYYAIRSFPKRLFKKPLKVGLHMIKHSLPMKRSITFDFEEDTGHFAVFKVSDAPNHVKPRVLAGQYFKYLSTKYNHFLGIPSHNG